MPGFIIFIIVLVVIWAIIATTTASNKQKEMERRRALQAELQRMAMQRAANPTSAARMRATPPQQISRGIAERFPDVLLPPSPQQQRHQPRQVMKPVPTMRVQQQPQMRRAVPPVPPPIPRRPASRRPAPPPKVSGHLQAEILPDAPAAAPAAAQSATTPAITSRSQQHLAGVDASAIRRWAQPSRLRQQFILTEIFQPPLALREPH